VSADDPTSLDRLHDIVSPPPAPWWPPAPGWYVVLAVGGLLLVWATVKLVLAWRRDRYRRLALAELAAIRDGDAPGFLPRLSELLKRTALAAYPREEVAALTGDGWLAFLDRTGATTAFAGGPGRALADGPYAPARSLDDRQRDDLFAAARAWVRHHRRGPTC
jgi:hypothetical protein